MGKSFRDAIGSMARFEIIRLENQLYILATSSRVDDRTRVLKHGETFAVFDRFGGMARSESGNWASTPREPRGDHDPGLNVGQGRVGLLIRRYERDVGVEVLDRVGRVTVEALK